MASATRRQLWPLIAFLAVALPLSTELEYVDTKQPAKAYYGDDEMLNDDLIVPKPVSDCPDQDEIGCSEVQAKSNDNLIYPTSKLSTARPAFSTRRQAEAPMNTQTAPTRSFGPREKLCTDDDEDCSETSGDDRAPALAGNHPPDETAFYNRRSTQVVSEPRSPGADDEWPVGGEASATGLENSETNETVHGLPPEETTDESTPSGTGGVSTSTRKTYGGPFRDHYQLAINMNIILIVGIAIGIVILLLILIVAVCKYKGQGPKAPAMGKSDRAKSYTYEACNTGPPHVPSASGGDPGEAAKTISSTSIAVGLPTSPGAAGKATTITATATTTATTPHSKPPRKGVKEWYV